MTTDRTPRNGSMRRAATTLAVMISLTASLLATAATPAQAVGSYANSTIADVALRYLLGSVRQTVFLA